MLDQAWLKRMPCPDAELFISKRRHTAKYPNVEAYSPGMACSGLLHNHQLAYAHDIGSSGPC